MKIKTSSLLLLGFAVVLAGCAAFVARGLLAPHAAERPAAAAQARATEAQVPPVWAAAAAKPVEPGEFLSGTAIKWVEMKADEAPASAISAKRPGDRTAAALLLGLKADNGLAGILSAAEIDYRLIARTVLADGEKKRLSLLAQRPGPETPVDPQLLLQLGGALCELFSVSIWDIPSHRPAGSAEIL